MKLVNAPILKQKKIAENQYLMTLYCPEIVNSASPGQFVMLRLDNTLYPLLRRPFSIYSIKKDTGELLIYYQIIGKMTRIMGELKENDRVSLLGPLGTGFATEIKDSRILLIGGGIGQAPLKFLAETLVKKKNEVNLVLGAKNSTGLKITESFRNFCKEIKLVTEDGSLGEKGYVTEYLDDFLFNNKVSRIYACGPVLMLKKIKELALKAEIPCQVSLEARMACGIGVCLGCTCKSAKGDFYPKVCTDGPVFWAEEVKLDE